MGEDNLSEILFKPKIVQTETSTLIRRCRSGSPGASYTVLDGESNPNWYRMLNRVKWIWQGIDPVEQEQILARIAAAEGERSNPAWLDTIIGYCSGNWVYEWTHQGMEWQQKALNLMDSDPQQAGAHWLKAAMYYNVAGYPYLLGDELAEQAGALACRANEEASRLLPYVVKELEFTPPSGRIKGVLYLPEAQDAPCPTLILCHGLTSLPNEYHQLFIKHLAPAGIAMLVLDMLSTSLMAQCALTQDSSCLHQYVLTKLPEIPWVDHQRIALLGIRFGANIALRLAYLEPNRLKAVACIGPIVHSLLCDSKIQQNISPMYMDVMASRLGMQDTTDQALRTELSRFSLKLQGLLGHRCQIPTMVVSWDKDLFSPAAEARLIINSCSDSRLLKVSAKQVNESFHRSLAEASSWIKEKLC